MHLVSGNQALYGTNLATPGASLRVVVDDSEKMTTDTNNILKPSFPKIEMLDWYGEVVRGAFAQDVDVIAKLEQNNATLFGATTTRVNFINGQASFTDLGLQGVPGSGPHQISFESVLAVVGGGTAAAAARNAS